MGAPSPTAENLLTGRDMTEPLARLHTTIHYLADPPSSNPSRWLQYYINDASRTTMLSAPHDVVVCDARPIADRLDLDREGFRLVPHRSAVRDFRDPAEVAKHHPRELEDLIRQLTGAARAFSVGPQLRFSETSPENQGRFNSHPARFVHADFTDESVHWMFDRWSEIRVEDYSRFASYNVWRVFTPPPQDAPLAVCDARSVAAEDFVDALAVMDPPGSEPMRSMTAVLRPNPAHDWYYFRDMTPDEVLIFKQHDSDPTRAHRVPHTAFADPGCPPGTPPRGSAKTRVMAVFD